MQLFLRLHSAFLLTGREEGKANATAGKYAPVQIQQPSAIPCPDTTFSGGCAEPPEAY